MNKPAQFQADATASHLPQAPVTRPDRVAAVLPPWPPAGQPCQVKGQAAERSLARAFEGQCTVVVDARGLEPPEPMLRILSATDRLREGVEVQALTDRRPVHLLPELTARGICHTSEPRPDGGWLTTLRRA